MHYFSDKKELSKNILATVAYYDVFSYPLTSFEIWKYLMRSDYFDEENSREIGLHQILHELKQEPLLRFVEELNGFYFLKGRSKIVSQRIGRSKLSFSKARRLKMVIGILKFVPFVRMIGVTGRLAMKNARPDSDWDLLIVLKEGHIWMGRTLVTLVSHFLGKRRYGKKIKDRVCLNYFVSEGSLEISTKDLYSANEYFFMYPVFGFEVFKKFQLKNRWISSIKPHYAPSELEPFGVVRDSFLARSTRNIGEYALGCKLFEDILRKIEKKKIMNNPKTKKKGGFIQASDEALVFLPELKGPKIFDRFKKRVESLT